MVGNVLFSFYCYYLQIHIFIIIVLCIQYLIQITFLKWKDTNKMKVLSFAKLHFDVAGTHIIWTMLYVYAHTHIHTYIVTRWILLEVNISNRSVRC